MPYLYTLFEATGNLYHFSFVLVDRAANIIYEKHLLQSLLVGTKCLTVEHISYAASHAGKVHRTLYLLTFNTLIVTSENIIMVYLICWERMI